MSLNVGCLPSAVGKQPSIPLIDLGKKMDVKLMMMISLGIHNQPWYSRSALVFMISLDIYDPQLQYVYVISFSR